LVALRELIKKGVIEAPSDPAVLVERGDFFKMAVRQIFAGKPQAQSGMTGGTAAAFLERHGIIAAADGEALRQPIDSQEAFKTVAALEELKSSGGKARAGAHKSNGHWFSQPAYAAENSNSASNKPLNYLDAA